MDKPVNVILLNAKFLGTLPVFHQVFQAALSERHGNGFIRQFVRRLPLGLGGASEFRETVGGQVDVVCAGGHAILSFIL